jgi:hypothetical protein
LPRETKLAEAKKFVEKVKEILKKYKGWFYLAELFLPFFFML